MRSSLLVLSLALSVGACQSGAEPTWSGYADPAHGEVPLPAAEGWRASLVFENRPAAGIWAVGSHQVFPTYATPEIVGLDDRGRCRVFVSYSGKWSPNTILDDHQWLGAMAHGDVDPRLEGAELYVGGQGGRLYQVCGHREGVLDGRLIARFPGLEIHSIVAGELDPRLGGLELLVFTRPGALYRVSPTGRDGGFHSELIQELPGRVRQAMLLPQADGEAPWIATVARTGQLALLRIGGGGPEWQVVYADSIGIGRLAIGAPTAEGELLLYSGHDDGRVLRHQGRPGGEWRSEVIHRGAQGNRGLVRGRFFEDPEVESLAIFGYSRELRILYRRPGEPWQVETAFVDADMGHSLCITEADGRNGTDEIVASGYGGRVVLLSRPPSDQ